MGFSSSIKSKPESNRPKKSLDFVPDENYVSEFPDEKLKNLLELSNDWPLEFELYTGSDLEDTESSLVDGLNIPENNGAPRRDRGEPIWLRKDLEMLAEDPGLDDYNEVPVESFGAALLSGYGWKEDVKVAAEVTKKGRRGGLGFTGDFPGILGNVNEDRRGKKGALQVIGKLKELRIKDKDVNRRDRKDGNSWRVEKEKGVSERVNWLRNDIRVRITSEELKRGRLFLKKGVVVDVVGPRTCDISMDGSGELVQGVDQEVLETVLPDLGWDDPVIVLYGRNKGVYGTLVERDPYKETGVVRVADTQELVNVKFSQVAEYTGGY